MAFHSASIRVPTTVNAYAKNGTFARRRGELSISRSERYGRNKATCDRLDQGSRNHRASSEDRLRDRDINRCIMPERPISNLGTVSAISRESWADALQLRL